MRLRAALATLLLAIIVVAAAGAIASLLAGWNFRPWLIVEGVGCGLLVALDFWRDLHTRPPATWASDVDEITDLEPIRNTRAAHPFDSPTMSRKENIRTMFQDFRDNQRAWQEFSAGSNVSWAPEQEDYYDSDE